MPEKETSTNPVQRVRGILVRGRWKILLTATVVSVVAIAALYRVPNRYTSQATLLVVPQQVPARYVTPTTETNIADAVQAMTQDVLSRTRLLELIDQFGLYAKERQHLAPEEVIELMRKYIDIEPVQPASGHKDVNAFQISFVAEKAALAQEVTSKLTSFFIQANLKTREDQAANTTNFLQAQLEAAKTNLTTQETKMREFKSQYLGELPEQLQGNLAIFSSAQAQLQNSENALDRAQQQKVYLESLIGGYQRLAARGASVPGVVLSPGDSSRLMSPLQIAQAELTRLQADRTKLLTVYKSTYPDVLIADRQIVNAQALVDKLQKADPGTSQPVPEKLEQTATAPVKLAPEDDSAITQLRSQLEANRLDIENTLRNEAQQKALIAEYQKRLNLTPVREQQLASILRDYDLANTDYKDLLGKEQQSQLATSLEKQQGGEQFRLVEPPSLPDIPSSPKRVKISLMAIGGGLFLGLVVAFASELARPTFHTTEEITHQFGAPLVIGLPLVFTQPEKRRRTWRRTFEWVGGSVLAAIVGAAEFYVLLHP
jgi:polysaccharide biosynthesis transport protein